MAKIDTKFSICYRMTLRVANVLSVRRLWVCTPRVCLMVLGVASRGCDFHEAWRDSRRTKSSGSKVQIVSGTCMTCSSSGSSAKFFVMRPCDLQRFVNVGAWRIGPEIGDVQLLGRVASAKWARRRVVVTTRGSAAELE